MKGGNLFRRTPNWLLLRRFLRFFRPGDGELTILAHVWCVTNMLRRTSSWGITGFSLRWKFPIGMLFWIWRDWEKGIISLCSCYLLQIKSCLSIELLKGLNELMKKCILFSAFLWVWGFDRVTKTASIYLHKKRGRYKRGPFSQKLLHNGSTDSEQNTEE